MQGVPPAISDRILSRARYIVAVPTGRAGRAASPALSALGARDWARLGAQANAAPTPSVEGAVLDATTSQPIQGAEVRSAALPSTPRSLRIVRRTDATGVYRIDAVMDGDYLLEVRALGTPRDGSWRTSRPRRTHTSRLVSGGYRAFSRQCASTDAPRSSFARTASPVVDRDTRARAERLRQKAFLVGDAHALTYTEVATTVGLGEADPLRALEHTPGLPARRLQQRALDSRRGRRSNPRHLRWRAAVRPNACHRGRLRAQRRCDREHDLSLECSAHHGRRRSCRPGGRHVSYGTRDQPAVLGGLSILAGRLATGGALESGRAAWTFGLRRSYVDLLSRGLANASGHADQYLPYAYARRPDRPRRSSTHRRVAYRGKYAARVGSPTEFGDAPARRSADWEAARDA